MAEYTLRETDAGGVIAFSGECTIEYAELMKKGFEEALERFDEVDLDATGVERADLVFLQLVLAVQAELAGKGKALTAEAGLSPVVVDLADEAGLTLASYEQCFWKKG